MAIEAGDPIPDVTLMQMSERGPQPVTTDELFSGKRIVLFAVPGAYTPTCSARHLPGFVNQAAAIRARGVDQIVCLAVNDAYVMDAWGKEHHAADEVTMVADGNGEFTRATGLEDDRRERGMGVRTQRCAMIVDDGVVTAIHIERPGEFAVSSAEAVLEHL